MSRTPSGTSSPTAEPPDLPPIYVDESLSQRTLPEALRAFGLRVVTRRDLFPHQRIVPDEQWLAHAGRQRWIVLTKDKAIRHRRNEIGMLKRAGVRAFVLAAGNLKGEAQADIFCRALRRMETAVATMASPFVIRITKSGSFERIA